MNTGRKLSWLEQQDADLFDRLIWGKGSDEDRQAYLNMSNNWTIHINRLRAERDGHTHILLALHQ